MNSLDNLRKEALRRQKLKAHIFEENMLEKHKKTSDVEKKDQIAENTKYIDELIRAKEADQELKDCDDDEMRADLEKAYDEALFYLKLENKWLSERLP